MVKFHSVRDRADEQLIHNPVSEETPVSVD
jgi:hypothetical protein